MNHKTIIRSFFIVLIVFSFYHLIRDVFQDYHILNVATSFLKMDKNWCGPYCNLITYPFELFILIGSTIVVRRNKSGLLGRLIIAVFVIWAMMFLYDYFIFN